MRLSKFYLPFFLFIILSIHVKSQKNVINQDLLWTRFQFKLKINEKYQLKQEVEKRTYWFPWKKHQLLVRTNAERKLANGWKAVIGFTYFEQTFPQDPRAENFEDRTELRPQFGLEYKQIISDKISLHHRYWGEFRFFEQKNGKSFEYGNNRTRYKIELNYSPIEKLIFKAFEEIHLNFGGKIVQNVFNQNRIGASIQYMLIKNFGLELGYFNWFQQRSSGVDFFNRHIIRFTFHYIINLKEKNE